MYFEPNLLAQIGSHGVHFGATRLALRSIFRTAKYRQFSSRGSCVFEAVLVSALPASDEDIHRRLEFYHS
jgi:hypothetical protein